MDIRWRQISRDFNRFLQNYRRLHNQKVQYLRVIEKHKDGYPHVHAILQFPNAVISIRNTKYFERKLYNKWKALWIHGHSDYQRPRKDRIGTLTYILKYLIKNTTKKTIWKKILKNTNPTITKTVKDVTVHTVENKIKLNGVKLGTWSRDFDWEPFYVKVIPSTH